MLVVVASTSIVTACVVAAGWTARRVVAARRTRPTSLFRARRTPPEPEAQNEHGDNNRLKDNLRRTTSNLPVGHEAHSSHDNGKDGTDTHRKTEGPAEAAQEEGSRVKRRGFP